MREKVRERKERQVLTATLLYGFKNEDWRIESLTVLKTFLNNQVLQPSHSSQEAALMF
jgi:hypothetical protein